MPTKIGPDGLYLTYYPFGELIEVQNISCGIEKKFLILERQILCQRRLGRMGCTCRTAHSAQARRCKICPTESKINFCILEEQIST